MRSGRLLLALAAALTALVLVPPPAFACSCVGFTPQQYVDRADAVYAGELVRAESPTPHGGLVSSGDPTTYELFVSGTFKGPNVSSVEFRSASSGASCGIEGIEPGDNAVFLLQGRPGHYTADLCGGTGQLSLVQAHRLLGEPRVVHHVVDDLPPRSSYDHEGSRLAGRLLIVFGATAVVAAVAIATRRMLRRR